MTVSHFSELKYDSRPSTLNFGIFLLYVPFSFIMQLLVDNKLTFARLLIDPNSNQFNLLVINGYRNAVGFRHL